MTRQRATLQHLNGASTGNRAEPAPTTSARLSEVAARGKAIGKDFSTSTAKLVRSIRPRLSSGSEISLSRVEAALSISCAILLVAVLVLFAKISNGSWADQAVVEAAIADEIAHSRSEYSSENERLTSRISALERLLEDGLARVDETVLRLAAASDHAAQVAGDTAIRIDLIEAASDADRARIDEVISTARHEMHDEMVALNKRISELPQARKVQSVIKPAASSASSVRTALPFRPLSVEMWGGDLQLAVRSDGNTVFLSEGDRLKNWSLDAIDAGAIKLSNQTGARRTLSIENGKLVTATTSVGTLTVRAEPTDARVRIMNIRPVYRQGMELAPGAYDVLVTRAGYAPVRRWVRVGEGETVVRVSMDQQF